VHVTLNGTGHATCATTLLELLGPVPDGHAVAVNREVVPRAEHGTRLLVDGDAVDVVTAVAGG